MLTCSYRQIEIDHKFQVDVIWIVWDILFHVSKHDKLLHAIIVSLRNIFCIKYSFSVKKKRKHILYFASQLITEPNDLTIDILNELNKQQLQALMSKIDNIYQRIDNKVKKELDTTKIIHANKSKTHEKIDMILKV